MRVELCTVVESVTVVGFPTRVLQSGQHKRGASWPGEIWVFWMEELFSLSLNIYG